MSYSIASGREVAEFRDLAAAFAATAQPVALAVSAGLARRLEALGLLDSHGIAPGGRQTIIDAGRVLAAVAQLGAATGDAVQQALLGAALDTRVPPVEASGRIRVAEDAPALLAAMEEAGLVVQG
jgi:hypothetical protein